MGKLKFGQEELSTKSTESSQQQLTESSQQLNTGSPPQKPQQPQTKKDIIIGGVNVSESCPYKIIKFVTGEITEQLKKILSTSSTTADYWKSRLYYNSVYTNPKGGKNPKFYRDLYKTSEKKIADSSLNNIIMLKTIMIIILFFMVMYYLATKYGLFKYNNSSVPLITTGIFAVESMLFAACGVISMLIMFRFRYGTFGEIYNNFSCVLISIFLFLFLLNYLLEASGLLWLTFTQNINPFQFAGDTFFGTAYDIKNNNPIIEAFAFGTKIFVSILVGLPLILLFLACFSFMLPKYEISKSIFMGFILFMIEFIIFVIINTIPIVMMTHDRGTPQNMLSNVILSNASAMVMFFVVFQFSGIFKTFEKDYYVNDAKVSPEE